MEKGSRRVIAAGLLFTVTACTSVQPLRTAPEPFITAKHPTMLYLMDKDGRPFTVQSPQIRNDSVVGVSPKMNKRVGLPLSSVGWVAAAQPDHTRTALLIVALGASGAGLGYALAHAGSGDACYTPYSGDNKITASIGC